MSELLGPAEDYEELAGALDEIIEERLAPLMAQIAALKTRLDEMKRALDEEAK